MPSIGPFALSRREWFALTTKLGLGGTLVAGAPAGTWAQTLAGKDPRLTRLSVRPPDYETPVALLDALLTPLDAFYVRCHMPMPPAADPAAWRLGIEDEVGAPATLSLADLRQLPETSLTVTLECAGNGRAFFDPPVPGIQWRKGAVGNAKWTGVRVADLLRRVNARPTATHLWVSGADRPMGTQPPFVRQVPMAKAAHPDTIVAWAMNDQPIPHAHGGPLRLIVPGWEGAYAIKWLTSIRVAAAEHDGFWVATGYRYPTRRVVPGAAVDARDMAPLTGMSVKSLITRPLDGAVVAPGPVTVAGFAWAGETDVAQVEVSVDGGATWATARFAGPAVRYSWRRFEHTFEATRPEAYTILSRATDARGVVQPVVPQWNPSGYLWNAPDQIRIEVKA
ncbi:MAG: sulfite oxidase [Vicinamibacterales bacterium]